MPIQLIDLIKPKNDGDFPMAEDIDLLGGWRVVADLTARDAIPAQRRKEGMRAKVVSNDTVYELKGGITNGDWAAVVISGGSVTGALLTTVGDMAIPIDFGDAGAVDPTPGVVFQSQADVNAELTAQGSSNFKHIYSVLLAFPPFIEHEININLAAGVHFADPAASDYYSLPVEGFTLNPGGKIFVNGRPLSEWTQIVAPLTVTAFQQASNDPWVQVAGTPFNGMDLRGRMAILSNGAYGIINAHDDNTLHLMKAVLPNPTVAVDTVFVGRPNTSYRNALVGTPTTRKDYYLMGLKYKSAAFGSNFEFLDLQLEGVGSFTFVSPAFNGNRSAFRRVIIDHEYERVQFGAYGGDGFQIGADSTCDLWDVGIYASPSYRPSDYALWPVNEGIIYAYSTFICDHNRPILVSEGKLYCRNLIVDNLGNSSLPSIQVTKGGFLQNWANMGGAIDTIRNAPGVGLELSNGGFLERPESQLFYFEGCAGPCIQLQTLSRLITVGNGFRDGGGNLDVGIEVLGPKAVVQLDSATDVTGANGDVRGAEGEILTYADIEANGPYVDALGNHVEKEP